MNYTIQSLRLNIKKYINIQEDKEKAQDKGAFEELLALEIESKEVASEIIVLLRKCAKRGIYVLFESAKTLRVENIGTYMKDVREKAYPFIDVVYHIAVLYFARNKSDRNIKRLKRKCAAL